MVLEVQSGFAKMPSFGQKPQNTFRVNILFEVISGQTRSFRVIYGKFRGIFAKPLCTFVVRESDLKILLIAGGGGSGAGKAFNSRSPIYADATTNSEARNGSLPLGVNRADSTAGYGGRIGQGGHSGYGGTGGGGGAGFFSHGERGKIEGTWLFS